MKQIRLCLETAQCYHQYGYFFPKLMAEEESDGKSYTSADTNRRQ